MRSYQQQPIPPIFSNDDDFGRGITLLNGKGKKQCHTVGNTWTAFADFIGIHILVLAARQDH
jgi:hypothetical protein